MLYQPFKLVIQPKIKGKLFFKHFFIKIEHFNLMFLLTLLNFLLNDMHLKLF
jgi:hypothetical protein